MTTLRETFAAAIAALLTASDAVTDIAVVSRSLDDAFSREDGSALVVHYGAEHPDHETLGIANREFDLRISFIGRGSVPETEADLVRNVAHPLVMGYTHDAITDILDGPVDEPKYANGDLKACKITMHYIIRYQTGDTSLSS